eukprot:14089479-Ditylum_brightwellii.AAC.2
MENQNYFLENQERIAVQGFNYIKTLVEETDVIPTEENDTGIEGVGSLTIMFIVWILRKQALDGSKLITSIEQGPKGVQYFCIPEEKKAEMIHFIDGLDNTIRSQF